MGSGHAVTAFYEIFGPSAFPMGQVTTSGSFDRPPR
jgi:hypothetical protein